MRLPFGFSLFRSAGPTDFVIKYRNGRQVASGHGRTFLVGPRTTIALVPTDLQSLPFSFTELANDDQQVVVTGELKALFVPERVASLFDFSVNVENGGFRKDGMRRSHETLTNSLRDHVRQLVRGLSLADALRAATSLQNLLQELVTNNAATFAVLGFTVRTVTVNDVRPSNHGLAAALEAPQREKILAAADRAVAERREQAAEDDRRIRQYEAKTEQELARERSALIEVENENKLAEAAAESEARKKLLEPYADLEPAMLVALGIKDLARGNVGEVNFTPELLAALGRRKRSPRVDPPAGPTPKRPVSPKPPTTPAAPSSQPLTARESDVLDDAGFEEEQDSDEEDDLDDEEESDDDGFTEMMRTR